MQNLQEFDERPIATRLSELSPEPEFGLLFHSGSFVELQSASKHIRDRYSLIIHDDRLEKGWCLAPDPEKISEFSRPTSKISREVPEAVIHPQICLPQIPLTRDEILSYSDNFVLKYKAFDGDGVVRAVIRKIMEDENLLRRFLTPMNSPLALQDTYRVAMQILGDQEQAEAFCKHVFTNSGYFSISGLEGPDKDIVVYIVLQKYADAYFRTKNAAIIFKKVQAILKRFFPNLPEAEVNFYCTSKEADLIYGEVQNNGRNNGYKIRKGKNQFGIRLKHTSKLSSDDIKNQSSETLQYSGYIDDFVTIMHEFLHVIFDQLIDPEMIHNDPSEEYDCAHRALSEGFATFGEMLLLRTMVADREHLGLGQQAEAEVFDFFLQWRLRYLEGITKPDWPYSEGVQLFTYLFMRDGEKILETLRKIDPIKAVQMKINNPIYRDAVDNGNFEPLLAAISKGD